jgi:hypothetical protein
MSLIYCTLCHGFIDHGPQDKPALTLTYRRDDKHESILKLCRKCWHKLEWTTCDEEHLVRQFMFLPRLDKYGNYQCDCPSDFDEMRGDARGKMRRSVEIVNILRSCKSKKMDGGSDELNALMQYRATHPKINTETDLLTMERMAQWTDVFNKSNDDMVDDDDDDDDGEEAFEDFVNAANEVMDKYKVGHKK